ncbi:hypothetical protein C7999DRAFT_16979 [Corynascus novoguineensis]|uniref:Uncharacterized protein n=1 Tax=Corynascus novoguineensis TaxID=1126955 RepID=A0AAN7HCJ9_9PEZI|nr:hypothetical protein C7999DRAFT_16979 [Corynascus novoguineensis]
MLVSAATIISIFLVLAAAAPEMMMEKVRERGLCVCTENSCRGPDCCSNGTC